MCMASRRFCGCDMLVARRGSSTGHAVIILSDIQLWTEDLQSFRVNYVLCDGSARANFLPNEVEIGFTETTLLMQLQTLVRA